MTTDAAGELRGLLARQRGLYGQLDALSQRQRALIEAGEGERLLALLQERQRLVEELSVGAGRIGELQRSLGWLAAAEREELEREADSLRSLAAAVAERDAEDEALLTEARDAAASELAGLRQSRRAAGAYGGGAGAGGAAIFADRRA